MYYLFYDNSQQGIRQGAYVLRDWIDGIEYLGRLATKVWYEAPDGAVYPCNTWGVVKIADAVDESEFMWVKLTAQELT